MLYDKNIFSKIVYSAYICYGKLNPEIIGTGPDSEDSRINLIRKNPFFPCLPAGRL
jgi:hypothetical protein